MSLTDYNRERELLQGAGVLFLKPLPSAREKGMADKMNTGDYLHRGRYAFAELLEVRKRAVFEWLEIGQGSQWLRAGSKNPRSGMDLFLHGMKSKPASSVLDGEKAATLGSQPSLGER